MSTDLGVLSPRVQPAVFQPTRWQWSLLFLGGLLFVIFALLTGVGIQPVLPAGLVVATVVAGLVWRFTGSSVIALIVLGSIHPFLMLLIFHFTHIGWLVKAAALWKELVVVALLLKAGYLAFERRQAPRVYLPDIMVVMFLAFSIGYLLFPSSIAESTLISTIMGLRADAFFLAAYFVGRGLRFDIRLVRWLIIVFCVVAVIQATVAALQFIMPSVANSAFDALSFGSYMELQRGDSAVTEVVRNNDIGGTLIPRAGGLLLSDLALAFYGQLAVALAAALFITSRTVAAKALLNMFLLAMIGMTVLTVTRSAMLALVPLLAFIVVAAQALIPAAVLAVETLVLLIPLSLVANITPTVLAQMFSPDEGSFQGHQRALEMSVELLRQEPFGRGLGTAGQIAQRFTPLEGITNESWYLQIATEMGVAGALLFVTLLLVFALMAMVRYAQVRDRWLASLCLAMCGATIGFASVGLTLHVWEGLTTSIIFWLLAGIVVRSHDIDRLVRRDADADRPAV